MTELSGVNPGDLWALIDKGGTLAVSLFVIVAFLRGWIVPRWAYNDLKERCNKATELAEKSTELSERQADAAAVLIAEVREARRLPMPPSRRERTGQ